MSMPTSGGTLASAIRVTKVVLPDLLEKSSRSSPFSDKILFTRVVRLFSPITVIEYQTTVRGVSITLKKKSFRPVREVLKISFKIFDNINVVHLHCQPKMLWLEALECSLLIFGQPFMVLHIFTFVVKTNDPISPPDLV
jgi:hypothetical protein